MVDASCVSDIINKMWDDLFISYVNKKFNGKFQFRKSLDFFQQQQIKVSNCKAKTKLNKILTSSEFSLENFNQF